MSDMIRAQQLHNKVAHGDTLTEAERSELEAWYVQQDAEESRQLTQADPSSLISLHEQVDEAAAQMTVTAAHIQTLAAENEAIRRDINALYQKLAQTAHPSAA